GFKFPDGTIQTTGGLASVIHDSTLTGNGTSVSPLGVNIPLSLAGSSTFPVIQAVNNLDGLGILASGGFGGGGVLAFGGNTLNRNNAAGGTGVGTLGGDIINGTNGTGGFGVFTRGGAINTRSTRNGRVWYSSRAAN